MAYRAGFQYLEQRNSSDEIVKAGVVGKRSAFANSDNSGIYDVIAENFRTLYEDLSAAGLEAKRAEVAALYERIVELTLDTEAVAENLAAARAAEESAIASASAASASASAAGTSATNAAASESNARKWAVDTASPDGADDASSPTGKTQSARTWALSAISSAASAATSAGAAHTDALAIADSRTAAESAAGRAETAATAAASSATAAAGSASAAASSATTATTSKNLAEAWAVSETSPDDTADTESSTGKTQSARTWALVTKGYVDTAVSSAESATASATSAGESASSAATSASTATTKASEIMEAATAIMVSLPGAEERLASLRAAIAEIDASEDIATEMVRAAETVRTGAAEAAASKDLAEAWAISETSPDGADDEDSPTGKTQSARTWALSAESSSASAGTAATRAGASATAAATSATEAAEAATGLAAAVTRAGVSATSAAESARICSGVVSAAADAIREELSDTGIGYMQVTKLGVTASSSTPKAVPITIERTTTFCLPPPEVLKFASGATDVVVTACGFDNSDSTDFIYGADSTSFDGAMHPKLSHEIAMSVPVSITDGTTTGYISTSAEIDFSRWKTVEGVSVE